MVTQVQSMSEFKKREIKKQLEMIRRRREEALKAALLPGDLEEAMSVLLDQIESLERRVEQLEK